MEENEDKRGSVCDEWSWMNVATSAQQVQLTVPSDATVAAAFFSRRGSIDPSLAYGRLRLRSMCEYANIPR